MSAATKRKHVAKEIISEFPPLPNPPELFVARILSGRGNNLHLVEAALDENQSLSSSDEIKNDGQFSNSLPQFLVSMPMKFRKSFWVKRGDFVLCSPIQEGDKVKAEIVRVLYKDDVNYFRDQSRWPKEFSDIDDDRRGTREDDSDDDMFPTSSDEDDDELEDENVDDISEDQENVRRDDQIRVKSATVDSLELI